MNQVRRFQEIAGILKEEGGAISKYFSNSSSELKGAATKIDDLLNGIKSGEIRGKLIGALVEFCKIYRNEINNNAFKELSNFANDNSVNTLNSVKKSLEKGNTNMMNRMKNYVNKKRK